MRAGDATARRLDLPTGCIDRPLNVRFGSLADISLRRRDVRSSPKSGHADCRKPSFEK